MKLWEECSRQSFTCEKGPYEFEQLREIQNSWFNRTMERPKLNWSDRFVTDCKSFQEAMRSI